MNPKYKGLLALVFSAFLGGAVTPTLVRIGLDSADPFIFNLLRSIGTLLFFSPILFKHKQLFTDRNFQKLTVLGGIGAGANLALFSLGITHTTVVASQLLYALLPVTVPVVAFLLLKEKINNRKALGATVGLLGILLLIFFSRSESQRMVLGSLYGNSLIFVAVIFYTFFIVISKKFTRNFSPGFISATTYLGLTFFFLPLAVFEGITPPTKLILSPTLILIVIISALASVGFMYCFQYGLNKVSSMTAAVTSLLSPEFGAVAGALFFKETLSPLLILSMIVVAAGVLISVSGERETVWQRIQNIYSGFTKKILAKVS